MPGNRIGGASAEQQPLDQPNRCVLVEWEHHHRPLRPGRALIPVSPGRRGGNQPAEGATGCPAKPFPFRLQPRPELFTTCELGPLQQLALVQGSRFRQLALGHQALELEGVHRDRIGEQVNPAVRGDEAFADEPLELEQRLAQRLPRMRFVPVLPEQAGQHCPAGRSPPLERQVGQEGQLLSRRRQTGGHDAVEAGRSEAAKAQHGRVQVPQADRVDGEVDGDLRRRTQIDDVEWEKRNMRRRFRGGKDGNSRGRTVRLLHGPSGPVGQRAHPGRRAG
jgi:hypothetical protein